MYSPNDGSALCDMHMIFHAHYSYPAANCQIVAQALNLPALPHNATIAQCCQQIMDYLGCRIAA